MEPIEVIGDNEDDVTVRLIAFVPTFPDGRYFARLAEGATDLVSLAMLFRDRGDAERFTERYTDCTVTKVWVDRDWVSQLQREVAELT